MIEITILAVCLVLSKVFYGRVADIMERLFSDDK